MLCGGGGCTPLPRTPLMPCSCTTPPLFFLNVVAIQLNEVATESELYIYVMRSYRMFEQAVYGAAYRQSAKSPGGPSGDFVPPDEGTRVTPHPISVCEEVVDTMEGRIRQSQYQQLEEAVDR